MAANMSSWGVTLNVEPVVNGDRFGKGPRCGSHMIKCYSSIRCFGHMNMFYRNKKCGGPTSGPTVFINGKTKEFAN